MARPVVVLALVLVAFVGLACAQTPSGEIPKGDTAALAAAAAVPAGGPSSDEEIGNSEDGASPADDVAEAPVGGPVPPGAFPPIADESQNSGASGLHAVSAVAGAAAVAAVAAYFF